MAAEAAFYHAYAGLSELKPEIGKKLALAEIHKRGI